MGAITFNFLSIFFLGSVRNCLQDLFSSADYREWDRLLRGQEHTKRERCRNTNRPMVCDNFCSCFHHLQCGIHNNHAEKGKVDHWEPVCYHIKTKWSITQEKKQPSFWYVIIFVSNLFCWLGWLISLGWVLRLFRQPPCLIIVNGWLIERLIERLIDRFIDCWWFNIVSVYFFCDIQGEVMDHEEVQ